MNIRRKILEIINKVVFKLKKDFFINRKNKAYISKKVIIFSNTAMGDTILSTPVIKTLKTNISEIYIELVVNKKYYALFKDLEYVDKVIKYDKSILGLLKHIIYIRMKNFDSIFFVHSNGPEDLFIALLSNTYIYKAINYPNPVSKEFLQIISNRVYPHKKQHIIEHRLDVIRHFNFSKFYKELFLPSNYNNKKLIEFNKITIGFQLGASNIKKMWPKEKFLKLIDILSNKYNYNIVLLGIKSEKYLADYIIENCKNCKNIYNFCGKTKITDLPLLLNSLNLLVTNDTGTLHMAIALKVPTVSLFGYTNADIFGPYQDKNIHKVIQIECKNDKCMDKIGIEEVLKNIKDILKCVE